MNSRGTQASPIACWRLLMLLRTSSALLPEGGSGEAVPPVWTHARGAAVSTRGAPAWQSRPCDRSLARTAGTITRVSVQLNHTIVSCRDQQRSAAFVTGIVGLLAAARFAHFLVVEADNGVSLDFAETTGKITPQHYAFLVGEEEFEAAFGRIRDQGLPYWADPGQTGYGHETWHQVVASDGTTHSQPDFMVVRTSTMEIHGLVACAIALVAACFDLSGAQGQYQIRAARSSSGARTRNHVVLKVMTVASLRQPPSHLRRLSGPVGRRVRHHRKDLVAAAAAHGVSNLRVFGSVARGEDHPGSDVDLLADFPPRLSLFGLGRIEADLEDILGARVDLIPAADLKPSVRERVEADLIAL
jgi:predicted nucleotidyltransferase/catechol 2,3-dioxygenase-like lactoylglutathione lyase family enzyme